MKPLSSDTPPEVEAILNERYRQMTPQEKIAAIRDLNRTVLLMAVAGIRLRHGQDIPEPELKLRLASLWLDRETMICLHGWDPEVEGY
jgi:hypothetical protein